MKSKTVFATITVAVVFFILGFVLGTFYWEHFRPVNLYDTGISDEEYIRIASKTIETQKFLEKYPNATAYVDRSGSLAVDLRVDKYDDAGTNVNYLRLRVFINPRNNRPTGKKFIDCFGKYVENNLLEYLQTEKCLE
ncbi:hypothetical protein C5S53_06635 [Methanophagales archaeon]|nr:hypothetical protein C5S53_06635 [Methanophagales archaeon]